MIAMVVYWNDEFVGLTQLLLHFVCREIDGRGPYQKTGLLTFFDVSIMEWYLTL